MATRRGKQTTSLGVLSSVPAQGPPRRWRKPPRSVCGTNQPSGGFVVSAVPAWPDSLDLFADKGFIFLSQHCNRKTNTAKPLELLPAWARCRGTLVAFVPAPLENPISTTDPAQNSQWAQPQSQQPPQGSPKPSALGFVHKTRVWEIRNWSWSRCRPSAASAKISSSTLDYYFGDWGLASLSGLRHRSRV